MLHLPSCRIKIDAMIKKTELLFLLLAGFISYGQTDLKESRTGKVTMITSQNIYVKFESTEGINKDDTLYTTDQKKIIPVMIVKYISSTSCSGILISNYKVKIGDELKVFIRRFKTEIEKKAEVQGPVKNEGERSEQQIEKAELKGTGFSKRLQGRISINSYSNISNNSYASDFERWNITFSLNADSIRNSAFSFSSYINFNYRTDQWSIVQNNLGNALRFYEFAIKYDFSQKTKIVLGRSINPNTSSLGAIDGLQFETTLNKFHLGLIAGSRPNFTDYGYDFKLFEYGAYISRNDSIGSSTMQNSIALFQQTNNFKSDRRYLYFQHLSNPIDRLNLFFSSEVDLFKKEKGIDKNIFDFTSIYMMATITPSNWLSLNASYDARKNVIYYETFKNFADSILESSMRQGLALRINLRPFNYVWVAFNYGYRFSKDDPQPSRNMGVNLTFTLVPIINSSLFFNYNKIQTGYVDGNYFSINMNKDLFDGSVNLGIGYKKINYNFPNGGINFLQNIAELDLSWRILSSLFLTLNYEGTFQDKSSYSSIYSGLNIRF
jgi:hypothetical protein